MGWGPATLLVYIAKELVKEITSFSESLTAS